MVSAEIIVVGMATVDTFLELQGESIANEVVMPVQGFTERLGGKGYLVHRTLRDAGVTSLLIAEVARTGSKFVTETNEPMALQPVLRADHRIWVATTGSGNQATFVDRSGYNDDSSEHSSPSFAFANAVLLEAIVQSRFVYLSAESHSVVEATLTSIERAERCELVVNCCFPLMDQYAGDYKFARRLLSLSSMLICNEYEFQALEERGLTQWFPNELVLVVTSGSGGCRYSTGRASDWHQLSGRPATASGKTAAGAGDVFNGALLGGLLRQQQLDAALLGATEVARRYVDDLRREMAARPSVVDCT